MQTNSSALSIGVFRLAVYCVDRVPVMVPLIRLDKLIYWIFGLHCPLYGNLLQEHL